MKSSLFVKTCIILKKFGPYHLKKVIIIAKRKYSIPPDYAINCTLVNNNKKTAELSQANIVKRREINNKK